MEWPIDKAALNNSLDKPEKSLKASQRAKPTLSAQLAHMEVSEVVSKAIYLTKRVRSNQDMDECINFEKEKMRNSVRSILAKINSETRSTFSTECVATFTSSNRIAVVLMIERTA